MDTVQAEPTKKRDFSLFLPQTFASKAKNGMHVLWTMSHFFEANFILFEKWLV